MKNYALILTIVLSLSSLGCDEEPRLDTRDNPNPITPNHSALDEPHINLDNLGSNLNGSITGAVQSGMSVLDNRGTNRNVRTMSGATYNTSAATVSLTTPSSNTHGQLVQVSEISRSSENHTTSPNAAQNFENGTQPSSNQLTSSPESPSKSDSLRAEINAINNSQEADSSTEDTQAQRKPATQDSTVIEFSVADRGGNTSARRQALRTDGIDSSNAVREASQIGLNVEGTLGPQGLMNDKELDLYLSRNKGSDLFQIVNNRYRIVGMELESDRATLELEKTAASGAHH